jgi:hypothetical protein
MLDYSNIWKIEEDEEATTTFGSVCYLNGLMIGIRNY